MADAVLGTAACAFLVLQPGTALSPIVEGRIRATVQERVSSVAVPARFIVVPELPETYSGKYMRRLLRAILAGEPLGDLGALKNSDCVELIRAAVAQGMRKQAGLTGPCRRKEIVFCRGRLTVMCR